MLEQLHVIGANGIRVPLSALYQNKGTTSVWVIENGAVAIQGEAIVADPQQASALTARGNLVAVITNGTAVLGLGDIGPLAGKPAQVTEDFIGPYELQDFNLYYTLRYGFGPAKVAFLSWSAWRDAGSANVHHGPSHSPILGVGDAAPPDQRRLARLKRVQRRGVVFGMYSGLALLMDVH